MDEYYVWDEASYDAVTAAGIDWRLVQLILRTRPRIRTHIGAVLRVVAQTPDGRWIIVSLIEQDDDTYLVVAARELTAEESTAAQRMIEGGPR